MGAKLTKDSIDLGIIVEDAERSLAFYRDTLGLKYEAAMPMPDGSVMHRLLCGTTVIKVRQLPAPPPALAAPGGIGGATGYRYWTISVSNIKELVDECAAKGYKIAVGVREFRPGVTIAIVEDPDGNWVEFLQAS